MYLPTISPVVNIFFWVGVAEDDEQKRGEFLVTSILHKSDEKINKFWSWFSIQRHNSVEKISKYSYSVFFLKQMV